jgi:hypothetical protein
MSKTYISASLRRMVGDRAQGNCEYCLIPETLTVSSHQVDHVIAEKHGGKTKFEICMKNPNPGLSGQPTVEVLVLQSQAFG